MNKIILNNTTVKTVFSVQEIKKKQKRKFTNDLDKTRNNNYSKRISPVTLVRVCNLAKEYTQASPGMLSVVDRHWFATTLTKCIGNRVDKNYTRAGRTREHRIVSFEQIYRDKNAKIT